jgi:hypothetical protein
MKTKNKLFITTLLLPAFLCLPFLSQAQVTIGAEKLPEKGAVLDLNPTGTDRYVGGLLLTNIAILDLEYIPASFTEARSMAGYNSTNGVNTNQALKGMMVYNTTANETKGISVGAYVWDGTKWIKMDDSNTDAWLLEGNDNATASSFIGTTTDVPLVIKVNGEKAGNIASTAGSSTSFGYEALHVNTSGLNNTAMGHSALRANTSGENNTAIGANALSKQTNAGDDNTAIGSNALAANTVGDYNTAIGAGTLAANTVGYGNVAIGTGALASNTSGKGNVAIGMNTANANTRADEIIAIGSHAMSSPERSTIGAIAIGAYSMKSPNSYAIAIGHGAGENASGGFVIAIGHDAARNSSAPGPWLAIGDEALLNNAGNFNHAIGAGALRENTTGSYNTAFGNTSIHRNKTGSNNVAMGNSTLLWNLSGSYNTALGSHALSNLTGSSNIGIGYKAGSTLTSGNNNILIGQEVAPPDGPDAQNNLRIGDWFRGSYRNGFYYLGVCGNPHATLHFYVSGLAGGHGGWNEASDRRLKDNITGLNYGLSTIMKLNPVSFTMKSTGDKRLGFIAQDVRAIVPEVVNGTEGDLEKGETLSIVYSEFVPVLTKAIQEQQVLIEQQQQIIEALAKRIEALENN